MLITYNSSNKQVELIGIRARNLKSDREGVYCIVNKKRKEESYGPGCVFLKQASIEMMTVYVWITWTPRANPSNTEWKDIAAVKMIDARRPVFTWLSEDMLLAHSSTIILKIFI